MALEWIAAVTIVFLALAPDERIPETATTKPRADGGFTIKITPFYGHVRKNRPGQWERIGGGVSLSGGQLVNEVGSSWPIEQKYWPELINNKPPLELDVREEETTTVSELGEVLAKLRKIADPQHRTDIDVHLRAFKDQRAQVRAISRDMEIPGIGQWLTLVAGGRLEQSDGARLSEDQLPAMLEKHPSVGIQLAKEEQTSVSLLGETINKLSRASQPNPPVMIYVRLKRLKDG